MTLRVTNFDHLNTVSDELPGLSTEYSFVMVILAAFKPPGIDSALFLGRANCPSFSWGTIWRLSIWV